ncbi:MAG TPA: YihY family inner membrane protein [Burkholderiales bacterium]|nr:YihY family inner membrane protein [Burkholderiales bacterium]
MPRRIYSGSGYLRFVWKRFKHDRCLQAAGSLTFTTLLSLVPLITVVLAVLTAFPVFSNFSAELRTFIWNNLLPEAAGKVVTVYLKQFTEHAARLTALGIIFLGVTALMLMLTIDRTLNTIWRVTRPRPLLNRLLIYWTVLTMGPLLIGASLSMTSWMLTTALGFTKQLPAMELFLLKLTPLLLSTVAYALLFLTVPYRYVPVNHAFAGAIVTAVGFEAMKRGFAFYIAHVPSYKLVYGTFASLPIFLLWIYLSWLVFLLGAVIAASLPNWRGDVDPEQRAPGYQFYHALQILRALIQSLKTGDVMNLPKLHKQLRLGIEEIEDVLQRLSTANWVRKAAGEGWVLVRDPEQLTVADVYRLFVFDPPRAHPRMPHSGIPDTLLQDMLEQGEMKIPLKTLFSEAGSGVSQATP